MRYYEKDGLYYSHCSLVFGREVTKQEYIDNLPAPQVVVNQDKIDWNMSLNDNERIQILGRVLGLVEK